MILEVLRYSSRSLLIGLWEYLRDMSHSSYSCATSLTCVTVSLLMAIGSVSIGHSNARAKSKSSHRLHAQGMFRNQHRLGWVVRSIVHWSMLWVKGRCLGFNWGLPSVAKFSINPGCTPLLSNVLFINSVTLIDTEAGCSKVRFGSSW